MKTIITSILLFTLFFSVDCIAQESHKPSNVQILGDSKTRAGRRELRREKKQHHAMMLLASRNEKSSRWVHRNADNAKYSLVSKRHRRQREKALQKENPQEKKTVVRRKLKEPAQKEPEQKEEVTQTETKIKG